MSYTLFRVKLHSVIPGISRNSLHKVGVISEISVIATGLEPTTTWFETNYQLISQTNQFGIKFECSFTNSVVMGNLTKN